MPKALPYLEHYTTLPAGPKVWNLRVSAELMAEIAQKEYLTGQIVASAMQNVLLCTATRTVLQILRFDQRGEAVAQGNGTRITARADVVVGMRSTHAARGSSPGQNPREPWARDAPGLQDSCSASE
jgi:hypothetical protein